MFYDKQDDNKTPIVVGWLPYGPTYRISDPAKTPLISYLYLMWRKQDRKRALVDRADIHSFVLSFLRLTCLFQFSVFSQHDNCTGNCGPRNYSNLDCAESLVACSEELVGCSRKECQLLDVKAPSKQDDNKTPIVVVGWFPYGPTYRISDPAKPLFFI